MLKYIGFGFMYGVPVVALKYFYGIDMTDSVLKVALTVLAIFYVAVVIVYIKNKIKAREELKAHFEKLKLRN